PGARGGTGGVPGARHQHRHAPWPRPCDDHIVTRCRAVRAQCPAANANDVARRHANHLDLSSGAGFMKMFTLVIAAALLSATAARAQSAQRGFSVVLLLGETQNAGGGDGLPPAP